MNKKEINERLKQLKREIKTDINKLNAMAKKNTNNSNLSKLLTSGNFIEIPMPKFENFDDEDENEEEYLSNSTTEEISFIELAIINSYLHDCFRGKHENTTVSSYGEVDNIGRITHGGTFDNTKSFWWNVKFPEDDNEYIFQTVLYIDGRGELNTQIQISSKKGLNQNAFDDLFKSMKSASFNNSEFKGQCIKVKMREGSFRGIEIINMEESKNELILNDTQHRYIDQFVRIVARGKHLRYLLNGEPGTGKTESIRDIARRLLPDVTFVIPEFRTTDDLTSIMEACEIFDTGVIVMDDIDLFLGNREHGNYTSLLGQFLSFFDGVKKRKISLLASTNDKGLVDKAAERPGRFNFTLDYSFLNEDQIVKVCNIHLDEKWRIQEVYNSLTGNVGGKKAKITGAFIANLAENLREMSADDEEWTVKDTITLIEESYKGFYASQVEKEKTSMGFIK
jgi:hypothetical protein